MTSTHKDIWDDLLPAIYIAILILVFITVGVVVFSKPSPEEQKRQDFVDGCKYYSNGAPDTSTKPWKCIKAE